LEIYENIPLIKLDFSVKPGSSFGLAKIIEIESSRQTLHRIVIILKFAQFLGWKKLFYSSLSSCRLHDLGKLELKLDFE
jgi:hypothetical protein